GNGGGGFAQEPLGAGGHERGRPRGGGGIQTARWHPVQAAARHQHLGDAASGRSRCSDLGPRSGRVRKGQGKDCAALSRLSRRGDALLRGYRHLPHHARDRDAPRGLRTLSLDGDEPVQGFRRGQKPKSGANAGFDGVTYSGALGCRGRRRMEQKFRRRPLSVRTGRKPQDARRILPFRARAGRNGKEIDPRRSFSEGSAGECEGVDAHSAHCRPRFRGDERGYVDQSLARSTYEPSAVLTTTRVPVTMWVGTMVRTPFDSMAGLNEPDAVCPFIAGSVSTISSVTFCGISMETATPSCKARFTTMPSWRYFS